MCGDAADSVARAVQLTQIMFRLMRRQLAAVLDASTRGLARAARWLGKPALATVPVSAVMLSRLETVNVQQPIEDVVQLLVGGRHDQVPVIDDGTLVGVVTRDDVAIGLREAGPHAPLGAAPRHAMVMVAPSDSLSDVLRRLRETPDAIALVVDRGAPVGLVTFDHLVEYIESA